MDRTILPGIPAGEDAGAVVGVEGLDSRGLSSTADNSKANPVKTRKAGHRARVEVREGRIGVTAGQVVGPAARLARSSADRER